MTQAKNVIKQEAQAFGAMAKQSPKFAAGEVARTVMHGGGKFGDYARALGSGLDKVL